MILVHVVLVVHVLSLLVILAVLVHGVLVALDRVVNVLVRLVVVCSLSSLSSPECQLRRELEQDHNEPSQLDQRLVYPLVGKDSQAHIR